MNPRRVGMRTICAVLATLILGACTSADWATWGNGNERRGETNGETTLSSSNVGSLTEKWVVHLGLQMNAAPVLAHQVDVNGTPTDLLYTGTENGDVYAVSTSGRIVWKRFVHTVAMTCSIYTNGVHGVSASPTYDASRHAIYTVGGNGYAYGLDASTGNVVPGWKVQLTTIPAHEVVWSPATLVGNHLYFALASHCDSTPYHGRIVDINPDTHTITRTWYVTGGPTGPDGGGIWGWGGLSVDPRNGDVYAATGNSLADPQNTPYGDAIVRLSSSLDVQASYAPTPLIGDDDFGSSPVLFQKPGCPPQLAVIQKNGTLFLFDRDSIASGPRQKIAFGVSVLIGVPAYSSATQMLYAINGRPSAYKQGVAAFALDSNCKLTLAWNTFLPITGGAAPVIANGVVYVPGARSMKIHALNATTGAILWDSGSVITDVNYPEPIVVDGHVYAVANSGNLYSFGL